VPLRFEATLVDPYTRVQKRLADDIAATLERIAPDAEALGARDAIAAIARATRHTDNGSAWLRATLRETRSLNDMVKSQAELWAGERKGE
jgi:carboxylate-amine ligase